MSSRPSRSRGSDRITSGDDPSSSSGSRGHGSTSYTRRAIRRIRDQDEHRSDRHGSGEVRRDHVRGRSRRTRYYYFGLGHPYYYAYGYPYYPSYGSRYYFYYEPSYSGGDEDYDDPERLTTQQLVDRYAPEKGAEQEAEPPEEEDPATPQRTGYASPLTQRLGGDGRVDLSFASGEYFMSRGNYKEAIEHFRSDPDGGPEDYIRAAALGLAHLAQGEFQMAAAAMRYAVAHHPEPALITVESQAMLGSPDLYDSSMREVLKRLEEEPENADLQLLAGLHFFMRREWAPAVEHLKAAEQIDPTDPAAARLRAEALGRSVQEAEQADPETAPE